MLLLQPAQTPLCSSVSLYLLTSVHQALQEAGGFPPVGNRQPALSDCCPWAVAALGQQKKNTEDTHLLELLPCLTDHVLFVCLSGYEGHPEKLQFCPEVQFALLLCVCCRWHQRGEGEMGI